VKSDPSFLVETRSTKIPPATGPGSGKEAWKALALDMLDANEGLSAVIKGQRETIRDLEAEIRLLRNQVATRKPKGGRERLDDETVNGIECALDAGQSTRAIGARFKVSPMTVSRVRKRMVARQAETA
jgi:hypothetical protein